MSARLETNFVKTKNKSDYEDDGLLPLVNIIFLLLIFFMIVGVIEKNILKDNLELPKVALDKFENKDVAKIFYDANKNIYLDDEPINMHDLREMIKKQKVKSLSRRESSQFQASKPVYLIHWAGRLLAFIHSVSF